LIDFVRQRSSQLSHGGHPAGVCEIGLRLAQRLFCPRAFGDVADGTGDKRALLRLQRTETDFHGKLRSVFPPSVQLQTFTHRPHPRLGEELLAVLGV
jgi:hypothetical protein